MPGFCFGENLPHNVVPDSVTSLTDLEAELCSPRIAFAKIYQLRMQRQNCIRGAVINVPADYSTSQRMLPRAESSDLKVVVDLKRKLEMKSIYKTGLTRPSSTLQACKDLVRTPLYIKEGVEILEPLFPDEHEEQIDADTLPTGELADQEQSKDELPKSKCNRHVNDDGFEIVSDDEELYADESEPTDGSAPVETYMDLETEANELKQRVFAVAPGEGNHPLNILRDPDGEELCFAKCFGGYLRSGYDGKPYFMIARHELRSADRRFARNASNIFYKMRKMHCQTVCSAANMTVRKANAGTVTAKQLLDPFDKEYICLHDLGYLNLDTLRTSPDYKAKMKRDIFAMIKQCGKPCWFLTLSSADSKWTELTQMLYEVATGKTISAKEAEDLSSVEKAELIANDPVTCARYFSRRVGLFLEGVVMKTEILGVITDFAGTDEFQAKGSPHVHLILWCPEAPVFEQTDDQNVIDFVTKYLTTDISKVAPDLGNVQRHRHTARCGGHKGRCSFGFPHCPMDETMILRPIEEGDLQEAELKQSKADYAKIQNGLRVANLAMKEAHKKGIQSIEQSMQMKDFMQVIGLSREAYILAMRSSINRATIFHERLLRDSMVNAFNVNMLNVWQANLDVQFILKPYAAAVYVASYIMKGQKGMSNLLKSVASGNFKNSAEIVRKTGTAWINSSEISAQEAVYHVLGLRLRRFSRIIQFINTNPPESRYRVALDNKDLKELDPDDTDCFKKNLQDKYGNRRDDFLDMCLADYAATLQWVEEVDEDGRKEWHAEERARPKVLRWVAYNKDKDFDNYCREQVMLFLPWSGTFEDLEEEGSWPELFLLHEKTIGPNREKYCTITEEAWSAIIQEADEYCQQMQADRLPSRG